MDPSGTEKKGHDLNTMFVYSGKADSSVYALWKISLHKFTTMRKFWRETLNALLTILAETKGR